MKKNSPRVNRGSVAARPATTNKSHNSGYVFDPGKKVWIFTVIAFLVVGIGVTIFCLRDTIFDSENKTVKVTMADGTETKMTVGELRAELNNGVFYDGIIIDGIDLSGKTKEEALTLLSDQVQANAPKIELSYTLNGATYPLDLSSIPMDNNFEAIATEAYNYGRPSEDAKANELIECYETVQELKNTPKSYTTEHKVSTDGVGDLVNQLLTPLNTEVVESHVSGFDSATCTFIASDPVDGCNVNIDKAISDTKALLDAGTYKGTIAVDSTITKATKTKEEALQGYGLISSKASNTNANNDRNHNINQACKNINGTFLMPGESFSFNNTVGKRTEEAGFRMAPTIMGGESVDAPGGGICQVSSMLFHSVVKADLRVDMRYPHQWPSDYVARGTDATVDWDSNMDFKFTNTSSYPIAISAYYDINNMRVSVAIYGHKPEDGSYIDFISETLEEGEMPETKYTADPELPVGEETVKRKPHPYIHTMSYKVWYDANGNEIKREAYLSTVYNAQEGQIEKGVLCPDGTIAELNKETGEVIAPDISMTEDSSTPSDTSITTETSETTTPTETVEPTESLDYDPDEPYESSVSPE
ncbi:MAG: VanW family protein [Clostridiales bacterium]|nr:VanW family protein [Clostridiales bacterium]